ncbi:MAG: enoyl-CoA hydratase/isomerase family protein [Chloroflexi bacterium]|nr:enoyl-CoA hydratase/isomerase family protein [Chloroflexota bacterium]
MVVTSSTDDSVQTRKEDHALHVTIARPEKLNALDWPTIDRLSAVLNTAEADDSLRVVILTGSGGRAFSAGADIGSIAESLVDPEIALREFVHRGQRLTLQIEHFPKPVIAAVNGLAYGGGCELVEACHLAIAAASATFAKPEIALGFPPTFGGTQRLPRIVGRKRALRMLLTTEPISAEEALAIGLVNEVVPDSDLIDAASALGRAIVRFPAATVAACLAAVARGAALPIEEALAVEASQFARVAWRPEVQHRLQEFLDRHSRGQPEV